MRFRFQTYLPSWMTLLWAAVVIPCAAQSTPNALWAYRAGGTNFDAASALALDAGGNSYLTGTFQENSFFGNTFVRGAGGRDLFLARYDPTGKFLWVRTLGGSGYDAGAGVAVDQRGNAFVTGTFSGSFKVGTNQFASAGGRDIFLAKYDVNGRLLWVRTAGGTGEDAAQGVAVQGDGAAFITGHMENSVTFGRFQIVCAGQDDAFVAKYAPDGEVKWVFQAGGVAADYGRAIAVETNGYVFVTGAFHGTARFAETSLTSRGGSDAFVLKLDNDGVMDWVRQIGGNNEDRGYGIAVTPRSEAYVTGSFVGPALAATNLLAGQGLHDLFLAKYDMAGKLLWTREAGGKFDDEAYAVATDRAGSAYVTGTFRSAATFDKVALKSSGLSQWEDKDIFVAKWDAVGRLHWARRDGGKGSDSGYGIAVDAAGQSTVTGVFTGDAYVSQINLGGLGLGSIFLLKIDAR